MKAHPLGLALVLAALIAPVRADSAADPAIPGAAFAGDRYTELWTKSPFAVATPDGAAASSSSDYQLVGLARIDGVSYVSLIDKSNSEHFVLASDKPVRNLKLVSVSRDAKGLGSIVMEHNGETINLQQEQNTPPPMATAMQPPPNGGMMNRPMPQFALPTNPSVGGVVPRSYLLPRRARDHRPPIIIPPPPPPAPPPSRH